jgi:hypothetical protein
LEERELLRNFWAGLGLISVILVSVAYGAEANPKKEALAAAENWLALIDKGEYAESWKEAAEYFKTAVSQDQWVNSLQAVRKPLGKLNSRTVKSKTYKTSLPGAPDGEYVVLQFTTSFENKKSALETVTPMKDKDGRWRVSGYFIK